MAIITVILISIIIFFLGVGTGGVHVHKQIYNNINSMKDLTDSQFRSMLEKLYKTKK